MPSELRRGPFSYRQAAMSGVTRASLKHLLDQGIIDRVARGIYQLADGDIPEEDQFQSATFRLGSPSAVCLVSALAFYQLTDVIPKKIWMMVPVAKRTIFRDIRVFRVRDPRWEIGIEKHRGYWVTTLERTLVDILVYRSRLGTQIGVDVLRRAIASKKTTLGKVMDMAVKLGVAHRIRPYLEALA